MEVVLMFMAGITFIFIAVIFVILSFFLDGTWIYYVPASLIVLSVWLKIIQSSWSSQVDSLRMHFIKQDPSAATGWVSIISAIYGIIAIFLGHWIIVLICIGLFILSLTMRFPYPGMNYGS